MAVSTINLPVIKLNNNIRNSDLYDIPSISGAVTLDTPITFTCIELTAATPGGALVRGKDGNNYWLPNVPSARPYTFTFDMVLTTGTDWQGTSRTTTAASMTFWGGQ